MSIVRWTIVLGVCVAIFRWLSAPDKGPGDRSTDPKIAEAATLDYSKPIYTTHDAMVCPLSLMTDVRADHSPELVMRAFYSFWGKEDRARKLGCEVLQEDVRMYNVHPMGGIIVDLSPNGVALFTIERELRNARTCRPKFQENQGLDGDRRRK